METTAKKTRLRTLGLCIVCFILAIPFATYYGLIQIEERFFIDLLTISSWIVFSAGAFILITTIEIDLEYEKVKLRFVKGLLFLYISSGPIYYNIETEGNPFKPEEITCYTHCPEMKVSLSY